MCRDHFGIPYPSKKSMLAEYSVPARVFDKRIADGWSLGKALETPVMPHELYKYKDHKGNWYKTLKDMATAYGLSGQAVRRRLDRGWTVREALETPPFPGHKQLKLNLEE